MSSFRKRDEMNSFVFIQLLNFVSDLERKIPTGDRWLSLSQQDKLDCNNIVIEEVLNIAPGVVSSFFRLDGRKYFIITGYDEFNVNYDDSGLKETDLSAGIFLRIVCELRIPFKRQSSKSEIYDQILFQQEEEGYSGHEYTDLIPYFQNILLYEFVSDDVFVNSRLGNMVGYLLTNNRVLLPLHFSDNILQQYNNLFLQNLSSINYNMLTKSLISVHWRDVFIEIYRCIESIFHSFSYKELHKSFMSSLSIDEFARLLEHKLKMRPTEEESLITIFDGIEENIISEIKSIKPSKFKNSKEATWFYNIRNNIVHSRPVHEEVDFEEEVWEVLILSSLKILEHSHRACNVIAE